MDDILAITPIVLVYLGICWVLPIGISPGLNLLQKLLCVVCWHGFITIIILFCVWLLWSLEYFSL